MKNNGEEILRVNNISKSFKKDGYKNIVLKDISFSLHRGEILALVGPSGCGKSTLLNIAAGLLKADSGELDFKTNSRIAYIFQEARLLPWMNIEDNISFVQKNFLGEVAAIKLRNKLLEELDLLSDKDLYPAQLSGGMKQRVEIIRALSIKPDFLLMDEAFKSVDLALKYQLRNLILRHHSENNFAQLIVTHDPEEAVLLADKILILSASPAVVKKVLEIDLPRDDRSLQNKIIYNKLQEILDLILYM
ncbi:MAG: ABC transporter ATP-binding protein [Halanaerobiaceae bacterium]